ERGIYRAVGGPRGDGSFGVFAGDSGHRIGAGTLDFRGEDAMVANGWDGFRWQRRNAFLGAVMGFVAAHGFAGGDSCSGRTAGFGEACTVRGCRGARGRIRARGGSARNSAAAIVVALRAAGCGKSVDFAVWIQHGRAAERSATGGGHNELAGSGAVFTGSDSGA